MPALPYKNPWNATHCLRHGEQLIWATNGENKRHRVCRTCRLEYEQRRAPITRAYWREHRRKRPGKPTEYTMARYAARSALMRAIRRGEISPQPCEVCNRSADVMSNGRRYVYAQIPDPNYPFDVNWKCAECMGRERQTINPDVRPI